MQNNGKHKPNAKKKIQNTKLELKLLIKIMSIKLLSIICQPKIASECRRLGLPNAERAKSRTRKPRKKQKKTLKNKYRKNNSTQNRK